MEGEITMELVWEEYRNFFLNLIKKIKDEEPQNGKEGRLQQIS